MRVDITQRPGRSRHIVTDVLSGIVRLSYKRLGQTSTGPVAGLSQEKHRHRDDRYKDQDQEQVCDFDAHNRTPWYMNARKRLTYVSQCTRSAVT